ncbi:MAG TPA: hypothetical protein VNO34_10205 [Actinomycetota bacterium]|nr:hypothetical protein [Actinomycetota bacterium]
MNGALVVRRRRTVVAWTLALAVVTSAVAVLAIRSLSGAAPGGARGPAERPVTGVGEPSLIIVAKGPFASEEEARAAAARLSFGEMQGFYVDRADNYQVFGSYAKVSPDVAERRNERGELERVAPPVALRYRGDGVGSTFTPGTWILLSAFRTLRGAEEFVELARAATGSSDFLVLRVRKLGGPYVGLGQEPHPDGSGPLRGPLPNQESFQK